MRLMTNQGESNPSWLVPAFFFPCRIERWKSLSGFGGGLVRQRQHFFVWQS